MSKKKVLIVGAGAAGLTCACLLGKAGYQVTVLEARAYIGGRIKTTDLNGTCIESGAEFIHGDLPYTERLFKEYGLKKIKVKGDVFHIENGIVNEESRLNKSEYHRIEKALAEIEYDGSVEAFLKEKFSDKKDKNIREAIRSFVEGFDAADLSKASILRFKIEWKEEQEWNISRPLNGYGELINALKRDCEKNNCFIYTNTSVRQISYDKNAAEVICNNTKTFYADSVIVTVPLGVLLKNSITFTPAIEEKLEAAAQLGFGDVIKFNFLFKESWWKAVELDGRKMEKVLFVFSEEEIPTWWTSRPEDLPLLTGWLAGPKAHTLRHLTEKQLKEKALNSLAKIFLRDVNDLYELLESARINNWVTDQCSFGAYSYTAAHSNLALKILEEPVFNTLYFAGEAFGTESGVGLVEGALESAFRTVEKIIIKA